MRSDIAVCDRSDLLMGLVVVAFLDSGQASQMRSKGKELVVGASHLDFWRAITFWIFADMVSSV